MLTGLTCVGADARAHADPLGPLCVAERVVRTTAAVECVRSRSGVADGTVPIPVLQRVIAPCTVELVLAAAAVEPVRAIADVLNTSPRPP